MAPFIPGVFSAPVSRHLTPAVPHLGRRAWYHARLAVFPGSPPLSALTAPQLPLRCPTPGWKSLAPPRRLQCGPWALMFTPCLCLLSFPLPSCSATGSTAGVGVGRRRAVPLASPSGRPATRAPYLGAAASPGSVQRLLLAHASPSDPSLITR